MTALTFDDATIERLFGAEDAENERDQRFLARIMHQTHAQAA